MAGMDEKRRWSRKDAWRLALMAAPMVASGLVYVVDEAYRTACMMVGGVLMMVAIVAIWLMDGDRRDERGGRGRV
jgi:hypothetical protein